jgi:hypothetical protein
MHGVVPDSWKRAGGGEIVLWNRETSASGCCGCTSLDVTWRRAKVEGIIKHRIVGDLSSLCPAPRVCGADGQLTFFREPWWTYI